MLQNNKAIQVELKTVFNSTLYENDIIFLHGFFITKEQF